MTHPRTFPQTLIRTLALAGLLGAALSSAQAMTKPEYKAAKAVISSSYKTDKAGCDAAMGNAKDICVQQAKGKEKVSLAELEASYTGSAKDKNKVLVAKADSIYAVAKERCDDQAGNPKDLCRTEAKAAHTTALADAKLGKEIGAAKAEAASDKSDAAYKVATEKCDAMAGDPKAACVKAAKAQFGKM